MALSEAFRRTAERAVDERALRCLAFKRKSSVIVVVKIILAMDSNSHSPEVLTIMAVVVVVVVVVMVILGPLGCPGDQVGGRSLH